MLSTCLWHYFQRGRKYIKLITNKREGENTKREKVHKGESTKREKVHKGEIIKEIEKVH